QGGGRLLQAVLEDEIERLLEALVDREAGREDLVRRAALERLAEGAAVRAFPRAVTARSGRYIGSLFRLHDRLYEVAFEAARPRVLDTDRHGQLAGLGVHGIAQRAALREKLVIHRRGEPSRRVLQPQDEAVPGLAPFAHARGNVERPHCRTLRACFHGAVEKALQLLLAQAGLEDEAQGILIGGLCPFLDDL